MALHFLVEKYCSEKCPFCPNTFAFFYKTGLLARHRLATLLF